MSHAPYLRTSAEPFLDYLDHWTSELPVVSLESLLKEHPPASTALVLVDMVNGFCKEGNLSSPRVAAIIGPVVELTQHAESHGIHHYLLMQDTHPSSSLEFDVYPPHCVEGSIESRTIDELQDLPVSREFLVFPKRTINPGMEPKLQEWLQRNPDVRQFIVAGNCTDICVHQMAMYLKLQSIAQNAPWTVVVPANCVDTFDIATDITRPGPPFPHPGDFMQAVFLYHMHLNGIRIVAGIE